MTGSADKKPVEWRFETVPASEDNSRLDRFAAAGAWVGARLD